MNVNNKKNVVIVLPTYNESENIGYLLDALSELTIVIDSSTLSVLVVDDSSPDGTGEIVQKYAKKYSNIHLLGGTKKQGLGSAYIRGFKYAIEKLNADIVFEMDADFSHNPNDIDRLLRSALNGSDFVIGSRYVPGGSIPNNWSWLRKANSKWGNVFARHVAGLGRIKDCTSGYRAIKTDLLKQIDLKKLDVKGYSFQISLLHQAIKHGAIVIELPIQFNDRVFGESKLQLSDIVEFVIVSFIIRLPFVKPLFYFGISLLIFSFFAAALIAISASGLLSIHALLVAFILFLSAVLTLQGIFTLTWMLYAWENPEDVESHKSPPQFTTPQYSFTALIPARHEEKVLKDTITAVANINYPENLKQVLVLCRKDDEGTINTAQQVISELKKENIKLVTFNSFPINKPHALNQGLKESKNDIVTIFDAEDEPHPEIYNVVNTVMLRDNVDVVQSGVQLMNYRTHWFSALNVLEYFFWFKSGLHFFSRIGRVAPLGGNTVFFKKVYLENIGGWDEDTLTEDADIGFRLALAGAKTKVVYDELHVTQEETPNCAAGFIKQRARWNQGFLQIFFKRDWLKLPTFKQKVVAAYILLSPEFQTLLLLYFPFAIWLAFTQKLPVVISLLSLAPLLILILQVLTFVVGLYEFTKSYRLKFTLWMAFKVVVTFYPYQLMLMVSSVRAFYRIIFGHDNWEKTLHTNVHREKVELALLIQDVK